MVRFQDNGFSVDSWVLTIYEYKELSISIKNYVV